MTALTSNHSDRRCNVVEDSVLTGFGHGKAQEDEGAGGHHSADSPVPVRSADGNGDGDSLVIDNVGYTKY